MPLRRKTKTVSLGIKTAELAAAVPQVMAHRLTRMALAGAAPSPRDRKEFDLMVAEKKTAFAESWAAMAAQAMRANQDLSMSLLRSFWAPSSLGKRPAQAVATQLQNAALGVLSHGLAPVHRRAVANAKRLGRTKLR